MLEFRAFVAVSPAGTPAPSTVRNTADEAWSVLRATVSEPDTLHDRGWTVRPLRCLVTDGY